MNRIVRLAVLSGLVTGSIGAMTSILPVPFQFAGTAHAQMLKSDPHAKSAARAAALDKAARMKKSATDGPGMSVIDKDAPLFCRVCHESQDKAKATKKRPTRKTANKR